MGARQPVFLCFSALFQKGFLACYEQADSWRLSLLDARKCGQKGGKEVRSLVAIAHHTESTPSGESAVSRWKQRCLLASARVANTHTHTHTHEHTTVIEWRPPVYSALIGEEERRRLLRQLQPLWQQSTFSHGHFCRRPGRRLNRAEYLDSSDVSTLGHTGHGIWSSEKSAQRKWQRQPFAAIRTAALRPPGQAPAAIIHTHTATTTLQSAVFQMSPLRRTILKQLTL